MEVVGYIARAIAPNSTAEMGPFIVQAVFLLLPPNFFAATLYMVYARVVRSVHGDRFSMIAPRWTTRTFVIGDFLRLNPRSTHAKSTFGSRWGCHHHRWPMPASLDLCRVLSVLHSILHPLQSAHLKRAKE